MKEYFVVSDYDNGALTKELNSLAKQGFTIAFIAPHNYQSQIIMHREVKTKK